MKCLLKFLFVFGLLLAFTSCFSLMKADRMVYAGSLGKRPDAVIIDSVFKATINKDEGF